MMDRISTIFFSASVLLVLLSASASATPEFAGQTGQKCVVCHRSDEGGELNRFGARFAAGGHRWPLPEAAREPLVELGGSGRAVVGYLHVLFGFLWFGTILYVHILLRPAYAEKGLPAGEVRLGALSMAMVGLTGLVLTASRVGSLASFSASRWGFLLALKIALYLTMVLTATYVVRVVGPQLREGLRRLEHPDNGVFDPVTLSAFDGREGRPAFIAYQGKVYDVSFRQHWKEGVHLKRHQAGTDLTSALSKAPHGAEKLAGVAVVGTYDESAVPSKTPAQRRFYAIAYLNLVLVFVVLFVVAFWRWWA